MSNKKDFATGTVLTAPSSATAGTSLVLQSGEGARMPAVPFFATAHLANTLPTLDNAEKLQVTAISTDTLTIVRAEGDTTAKSIAVGWRISNAVFAADFDFAAEGVLMDEEVTNLAQVKAFDTSDYATAAQGTKADNAATASSVSNVDNTTDAGKPVSTAQQTALNLKANLASPGLTGTPTAPTQTAGNSTTRIATTAFTTTALNLKANLASPTFTGTVSGVTSTMVGLGNVDNTSNATERAAAASLTNKDLSASSNTFPDFYPVGTIYENKSNSANPSTYLPGQSGNTWTAITDKFIVARGGTYTGTGGSATHTHPLSDDGYAKMDWDGNQEAIVGTEVTADSYAINRTTNNLGTNVTSAGGTSTGGAGLGGDTDSASTIPPYQAVYVWERTA